MAVGGGRQLGDAALGTPPVPGSEPAGGPAQGQRLHRSRLRVVPGAPRCPQSAEALVRLRRLPAQAGGSGEQAPHAAGHCGGGDGGQSSAGHSADRRRQVCLLPAPGPVLLSQHRRPDGGDLAPGGADGGPGGGTGSARHRLVRGGQRTAVHARARGRARTGAAGRRGHPARLSRATPVAFAAPRPEPARDRRLGAGRGPLPVTLGARLPARLPLRGPFHPGEGRGRSCAAGAVSHRDRQARRGGGHHPPLPGPARHRTGGHQRRRGTVQSHVRGHAHLGEREVRPYPSGAGMALAGGKLRRRHHLLRHAPAERGGGGVPATEGRGRGPLPRRPAAGDQEGRAAALHQRRTARHRRHQRLRHGHRQARRAAGGPRGHPRLAGELPAGGGPRRPRPGRRAVRAAVRGGRRGAAVRHVGALAPDPARDPRHTAGAAQPRPEEAPGRRGGGHRRRDPRGRRGPDVRARFRYR